MYSTSACAPPPWDDSLGDVVCAILTQAIGHFATSGSVDADPNLADDAFLLGGRAVTYCGRHIVARPALVAQMIDAAAAGCTCAHPDAGMSACSLIRRICSSDELLKAGVLGMVLTPPRGPHALSRLMACVAGAVPRQRLEDAGDALMALYEAAGPPPRGSALGGADWLVATLQAVPDSVAGAADKSALASALASGPFMPTSIRAIGEFSDTCRRTKTFSDQAVHALLALGG